MKDCYMLCKCQNLQNWQYIKYVLSPLYLFILVKHCCGMASNPSNNIGYKSESACCVGHSATNSAAKLIPHMFSGVAGRSIHHLYCQRYALIKPTLWGDMQNLI
ncbi:hypothetical protein ILYODFUR_032023 [Ilyodon furcidens]|uniref:Uncharacterized protein n=1 Tax=Ilyodon furcidens TaxID=33524 RepID=A0ABV0VKE4_9TELE